MRYQLWVRRSDVPMKRRMERVNMGMQEEPPHYAVIDTHLYPERDIEFLKAHVDWSMVADSDSLGALDLIRKIHKENS